MSVKQKRRVLNQSGSVSMLTVLFVSLVLSLVAVSTIRIMIKERRESTDTQLSTQAFFAAESGIEDALLAIEQYTIDPTVNLNGDSCDAPTGVSGINNVLDADAGITYSCMLIDLNPGTYTTTLPADGTSIVVPLRPADPSDLAKVRIDWHINDTLPNGGDGESFSVRSNSDLDLPRKGDWKDGSDIEYPALMRAGVFSHPTGSVTRDNLSNNVGFLNPAINNSEVSIADLSGNAGGGNSPLPAFCDTAAPTGDYACSKTISGFNSPSNRIHYLRLNSVYKNSHVRVTLLDAANNTLEFENVQAEVDVTGRSNDVFRRVNVRIPLEETVDFLPDFAVLTAEGICKELFISSTITDTCPPHAP